MSESTWHVVLTPPGGPSVEPTAWLLVVEPTGGYSQSVSQNRAARRIAAVPRPPDHARYEGLWVALLDGEVVAAEPTSHGLALRLQDMDHPKRSELVLEYVRPTGDSYIVGAG